MRYLEDLSYWVNERESMRLNKEAHLEPYTTDVILATNRWCNVHREDDKVTRWIFDNFMPKDRSDPTIPFAMCLARLVNWPDTLRDLTYPVDGWTTAYRNHFLEVFAARRVYGLKSWTGAYMVTGGFSKGGETKEVIIARVLDGAATTALDLVGLGPPLTLSRAADILSTPGMGTFLVAQVIADLKNTDHLSSASDWIQWCAPGPGSCMGLNFMHERPRTYSIPPTQFIKEVNEVREFLSRRGVNLHAQNTQNCLCELSKYIRARYFGERLKNSYTPVRGQ